MIISVFPYIENESVRRLTGDVLSELDRLKCHVYVTKEHRSAAWAPCGVQ